MKLNALTPLVFLASGFMMFPVAGSHAVAGRSWNKPTGSRPRSGLVLTGRHSLSMPHAAVPAPVGPAIGAMADSAMPPTLRVRSCNPFATMDGCPSDASDNTVWSTDCDTTDDTWELVYWDDQYGPDSEEDTYEQAYEQTDCYGGHPECSNCNVTAPFESVHPQQPMFSYNPEWLECELGGSCEDGEVQWTEFEIVDSDWIECDPFTAGCYDNSSYQDETGTSGQYYYWCDRGGGGDQAPPRTPAVEKRADSGAAAQAAKILTKKENP